jgi:hypothetical protein
MCFSATASFTAGAALLAVGAYTMRQVSRPAELPYASIPALFGIQQLVEGALWLTLPDGNAHFNDILTHIYALFSHILWPIFVPIAVLKMEPEARRRSLLWLFAIAGAVAGIYLAYFWLMDPTTSLVAGDHILYVSPHFFIGPILALYIVGTCGSPLVSSYMSVRWFGLAVSASLAAAYIFYAYWFISVWCFFAAIISVTILLHFRHREPVPTACPSSAIG